MLEIVITSPKFPQREKVYDAGNEDVGSLSINLIYKF